MKTLLHVLLPLLCLSIYSCNNTNAKRIDKKPVPIDTTNSFKIGSYWATPKKSFDFNSLGKYSGDTIEFVTCADYVYSPFGKIEDKKDFKSSLLKNFNVVSRTDSMDVGPEEFQILKLKSSKLIFFFDKDPEASAHSNILKGEIYNSEVKFAKGIKVEMTLERFYKTFFKYFPDELKTRYKVIVLLSCVEDIKHIYTFKDGVLESVVFQTDTYWKVNY
jgi:hypothetical protein